MKERNKIKYKKMTDDYFPCTTVTQGERLTSCWQASVRQNVDLVLMHHRQPINLLSTISLVQISLLFDHAEQRSDFMTHSKLCNGTASKWVSKQTL